MANHLSLVRLLGDCQVRTLKADTETLAFPIANPPWLIVLDLISLTLVEILASVLMLLAGRLF